MSFSREDPFQVYIQYMVFITITDYFIEHFYLVFDSN